ncbi:MAG TPA: ComF family protein [Saprospiraceae bacterium]|nr:ComF family protein [Saprospiraceae bacterium]MCB9270759.1 ComF family protein [Lewinellaceae bacterium]HPG05871.1 ComF family protein [Saprospiraceae bacterium]HPR00864.1 ComF family protein [Saprospiraceae bacterium]HRV83398.1 ComF family protein [Saprospiraceae bacterium]
MLWLRIFKESILHLLYPPVCVGCGGRTAAQLHPFCVHCLYQLPFTGQENFSENEFTDHFAGRIPLTFGMALMYYEKNGIGQHVIQRLKYHGRKDLGRMTGDWLGQRLSACKHFPPVDLIIPVPLHWRRRLIRGYNQSEIIAQRLASHLNAPVSEKHLVRRRWTGTQTKRKRLDRLEALNAAFKLQNQKELMGKHLLLVDDVMTTGATIEACAKLLLTCPDVKVSAVTIAQGT